MWKKLLYLCVVFAIGLTFIAFGAEEKKGEIVKLKIWDRTFIEGALPTREGYVTGLVVKDIRAKVRLKTEEIEEYEIKSVGKQIRWNPAGIDYEIEVTFTPLEIGILQDAFKKMDREKSLPTTERALNLYKLVKDLR